MCCVLTPFFQSCLQLRRSSVSPAPTVAQGVLDGFLHVMLSRSSGKPEELEWSKQMCPVAAAVLANEETPMTPMQSLGQRSPCEPRTWQTFATPKRKTKRREQESTCKNCLKHVCAFWQENCPKCCGLGFLRDVGENPQVQGRLHCCCDNACCLSCPGRRSWQQRQPRKMENLRFVFTFFTNATMPFSMA